MVCHLPDNPVNPGNIFKSVPNIGCGDFPSHLLQLLHGTKQGTYIFSLVLTKKVKPEVFEKGPITAFDVKDLMFGRSKSWNNRLSAAGRQTKF